MASSPRRVAVIGAGPAGIAATSQLLALNDVSSSRCFDVTLFDRRSNLSGVWEIDPNPGPCVIRFDANGRAHALWSKDGNAVKDGDDHGRFRPPGAMYEGLRTNLTCDIMAYRSAPFAEETDLFPTRATVEEYLNRFGENTVKDREGLEVRLETAVNDVRRISHQEDSERIGGGSKWSVKSIDLKTDEETQEVYDHVVIASGRCSTPTIPAITNLDKFRGQILHSAWYRSPLPFVNCNVLVVGNSSSGSDIARELSGYILRTLPEGKEATDAFIAQCKTSRPVRVLHSYEDFDSPPALDYDPREPDSPEWSKTIQVVPKMQRITDEGKVVFEDGSQESVDTIIFGTGYACDFPHLDQNVAPFDTAPLIPPPPARKTQAEARADAYVPPSRTAPFLTNLDDWYLFYGPDPSICALGVPFRIVPMPFTQLQSRIVAAGWAGKLKPAAESTGLPRLDTSIPTTDSQRWTSSRRQGTDEQTHQNANHQPVNLGFPSDKVYQNTLLSLLPPELRQAGKDEEKEVPGAEEERGDEAKKPIGSTDEGWAKMAEFRNERRADTKRLRRVMLGY